MSRCSGRGWCHVFVANEGGVFIGFQCEVNPSSEYSDAAQNYHLSHCSTELRYSGIMMRGSPRAIDNSAMERKVRLGNPVVHLDTTASLLPSLRARSLCVMLFFLRMESMRAMMLADICTSVIIASGTAATFLSNHSCLFFIFQKLYPLFQVVLFLQYERTLCLCCYSTSFRIVVSQEHIRTALGHVRTSSLSLLRRHPEL